MPTRSLQQDPTIPPPTRVHPAAAEAVGRIVEGVKRVMSGELTGYTIAGCFLCPGVYRAAASEQGCGRWEVHISGPDPQILRVIAYELCDRCFVIVYDDAVLAVPRRTR